MGPLVVWKPRSPLTPGPSVLAEDNGVQAQMCPGLQAWVPTTSWVVPVEFGISLCLHVSSAELQPGCCVRGIRHLGAQARGGAVSDSRPVPVGHGELCGSWGALWVMGSPEHHGEPCGSRGALWITGSSAAHGELCSTWPLGALGSFCRQYGTSGCPDPLQPAEKWGNDAALTPINTSPLMAPPEGTGLLATLAGWAGSCD